MSVIAPSRDSVLVGSETPRLWTPPLRELTPETSKGFEVIEFARDVLKVQLMPWQQWLLIHGLELLPDGTYRFTNVFVLVSRQNGKTLLLAVLTLWRLLLDNARLVLGTSTNVAYAQEAWQAAIDLAAAAPDARQEFRWPERRANGEQTFTTLDGARYKIAAANRRGGRSLAVDLGIADELREHQTWDAWAALSGTTTARPDPQIWALSNAGDDTSIVLNHFRNTAVTALELGDDPGDTGVFEWSAWPDAELTDRAAWVQSNPALGHTITERTLIGKLKLPPNVFRTEHMCIHVPSLDSALDTAALRDSIDDGTMDALRDRIACCIDVAPDLEHVTLMAAAVTDDQRVRAEVVAAWDSVDAARDELPAILARVKPRILGWYPSGPGAALAADLAGVENAEAIKADVTVVCQGLAEQVTARKVLTNGDPLIMTQATGAERLPVGDGFRFVRKGAGHCDAVYALAGAVHLARTLPPPRQRPFIVVSSRARRAESA